MSHHDKTSPIDPTKNVLDLVAAETKRQDDLRDAETRRVDQLAVLRASYEEKLAEKEAARLNAIRDIDVKAVSTASEKQEAAAKVLAANLLNNELTLRTLVATTALAAAESQTRFATGIMERLKTLEESRYEIKGKSGGIKDTWGWIFGAVMGAVAIGGFVFLHYK